MLTSNCTCPRKSKINKTAPCSPKKRGLLGPPFLPLPSLRVFYQLLWWEASELQCVSTSKDKKIPFLQNNTVDCPPGKGTQLGAFLFPVSL